MGLLTAATTRRCLRSLSDDRFVAFVAALWAARGAETRVRSDEPVVDARRSGHRRTLRVVTGRRAPVVDDSELLVLSRPASSVRGLADHGGRVVDADDLHAMVLYAVPRAAADDLCRRFFDRPLATTGTAERPVATRVPEYSASLVVGLLGVALVVASVVGGPALYGDDTSVFGAPDSVGADPMDTETTATVTSTPRPGDDGSDSFESTSFPPGLGPGGVVDHDAAADAHAEAVTGRSYRLTITYREYVDGEPNAFRRETVFVAEPTRYRTELEGAGRLERSTLVVSGVEAYADGETRYERRVVTDEFDRSYTVDTSPVRGVQNGEGRYADRVERYVGWYLSVADSDVVDIFERGDTRYYWIRLGRDTYAGVQNSTGSALIDGDGVVHEIRREYDLPGEGNVSAVVTLRYTDLGTTTVGPPAWHETPPTTENGSVTPPTTENGSATSTPTPGR